MQCDWITAEIRPRNIIPGGTSLGYETGYTLKIGPSGEVELESPAWQPVESHETHVALKSPDHSSLWFSGNPVKWLQGHNLFGSDDALGLLADTGVLLRQKVGLWPGVETWKAHQFGVRLTRLDLTRSYRFPTDAYARDWLRSVAASARSSHGGAVVRGTTVIWGKGSEHWTMVAYLKSDELAARGKTHKLASTLTAWDRKRLTDWAGGVVRFELRLKRRALTADGGPATVSTVQRWITANPLPVWQEYFNNRITWNRNVEAFDVDMIADALPPHLKGYLARWKVGEDLRRTLPQNTFYRTRRALMNAAGIDIATPPPARPADAPAEVSAALDPAGWDPEPIEALLYRPGRAREQYGLDV